MLSKFTLAAAAVVMIAPMAASQVFVVGSGLGRDCYEAAKFGRVSSAEGERICNRALSSEPMNLSNRAATYTNRGVLRMRMGQYEEAIADYNTSKGLRPNVGATYLNEGAALIFTKDFNGALDVLNTAIELESEDLYAAYYNRAIAREKIGDVEGAYFDFLKSSELRPDWELAQRQLSRFSVINN